MIAMEKNCLSIIGLAFFTLLIAPRLESSNDNTFSSIYWSDGDSGRVGERKFRLANVDAPETGRVGARGGAECEAERQLGYEAKAVMVAFTKGKELSIVREYGKDRYNRVVIDLNIEGEDVSSIRRTAGHLRPWPHRGTEALSTKPDWCANE